ncbi:sugar kinase [Mycetocola tolaasinivorans]|uniref:Sugar kinase n=1 Tax=Mycetocola tolaasinivorans TaxID=76635 RepID=A0A3L7A552_9MICO|nr:sugar kinase [Mycetocola tolaasinivorans]RLP74701.1 sugar kinase [Mycetocola tolaasinivorans]
MSRVDTAVTPTDVLTFGETMALMRTDSPGPLATAHQLGLGIGGAETNVAIALRRLGTDVTWIGRVGDDGLGEKVLREVAAEGVRVVPLIDPAAPTGLMIKERRTGDHTRVTYYRAGSAASRLTPADVSAERISSARLLHVTGITPALSTSARETVFAAVDSAREHGVPVSLDLNYRAALWSAEEAGRVLRELVTRADIVFAGDDEAALVVGSGACDGLARGLAALGPAQVIIKRGAHGAHALIEGVTHDVEAVPIRPVDTVGAGDAFVAGYLAEYLAGEDAETRLHTAVRTGAFACLVAGDWEGMPTRRELGLLDSTEPVQR